MRVVFCIASLLINVYFSCYDASSEYRDKMNHFTSHLESTLSVINFDEFIVLSDTNYACDPVNVGYNNFTDFLIQYNLSSCDGMNRPENTYVNLALNHDSCTYHFLSTGIYRSLANVTVTDRVLNHSDHSPVSVLSYK